jgi:hypothetical protein
MTKITPLVAIMNYYDPFPTVEHYEFVQSYGK